MKHGKLVAEKIIITFWKNGRQVGHPITATAHL